MLNTFKRPLRPSSRCAATAFTLIELLVVIAIIAILAAILFPVFARAQESARKSSCLSNEKQILLGVAQYYQDFDEKGPNLTSWAEMVQPYVKSEQLFVCPSDANDNQTGLTSFHIALNSAEATRRRHQLWF